MHTFAILCVILCMLSSVRSFSVKSARNFHTSRALNMGLHDHSLKDLSGKDVKMDSYKGKVVLLENVASL